MRKNRLYRIATLALLWAFLLFAACPARAQGMIDPVEIAKSNLTEVLGYTAQEAETFDFNVTENQNSWTVRFAPPDHTKWQYRLEVNKRDGSSSDFSSPFATSYENYPGQNAVQDVLRTARENGWFSHWDDAARAAFAQKLAECEVRQADGLQRGLATGQLTAAQAIDGFFRSCYGERWDWTPAVLEWRDEVLLQNGLTLALDGGAKQAGSQTHEVVRYGITGNRARYAANVTEFYGEIPPELAQAFAHPKLAGWTALCGALLESASSDEGQVDGGTGLAAFEKGEERLLVALLRGTSTGGAWQAEPVGDRALLPNRELRITYNGQENAFSLEYPASDALSQRFRVQLMAREGVNGLLCGLLDYHSMNEQTGEGVVIDGAGDQREAGAYWYHVTTYAHGQPPAEEVIQKRIAPYLNYIDAEAFPKSAEECRGAEDLQLPEGYGVTCGVHLRKKTSSRSADLGEYHRGTLVQVLALKPGDPYQWAHVRIGNTEGYMSALYVDYPGTECVMHPLEQHMPLPVAMTMKELALKKGTGWFDGTVQTLPKGTKMHVMAVCGDWLHVMVPGDGEPGWLMDVNGIDGYVRASDVTLAATALQLDWVLP